MKKQAKTIRNWCEDQIKDDMVNNYLKTFTEYVSEKLEWYNCHRKWKGVLSNILLISAILTFSLSFILIITKNQDDTITIFKYTFNVYSGGYVCLLLASTMLLLDRLFGHSTGWIRYMMAQLEIEKIIGEYHAQWLNSISKMDKENLTYENRVELITLLSNFDSTIKALVIKETLEWKSNFTVEIEKFRSSVDTNLQKAKTELESYQSELKKKQEIEVEHTLTSSLKGNLILQIIKPEESIAEISIENENMEKPLTSKVEAHQLSTKFLNLKPEVYGLHGKLIVGGKVIRIIEKIVTIQPNTTTEESVTLEVDTK